MDPSSAACSISMRSRLRWSERRAFGDTLQSAPPDFFLPLNTEPFVESNASLNRVDLHWLYLIGRIRPGATSSSIEAQMRVELKQWLRSHWGDMSANDRAKFPEQTQFLKPGGVAITSNAQRLQILTMVSASSAAPTWPILSSFAAWSGGGKFR
jgi:hypothetical protein